MRKLVFIILATALLVYLTGCGKKESEEAMQEPMTMETMAINAAVPPPMEVKGPEVKPPVAPAVATGVPAPVAAGLEPTPPQAGKPTAIEIQTALKSTGFYTGPIDGKIGKMTKEAIREFQKANNLQVDGKVGPKTWEALKQQMSMQSAPAKKKR
jgi:peptidoglycan hydrolase-like protein with peptidoglycan-binding domain